MKAVKATFDVHEAVFAAVQRGERRGTYQLPGPQFCRADRAGLRIAGSAFASGFKVFTAVTSAAKPAKSGDAYGEKKGIAKPKQENANKQKNQNFEKLPHYPSIQYTVFCGSFIYYRYANRESGRFKPKGGGDFTKS